MFVLVYSPLLLVVHFFGSEFIFVVDSKAQGDGVLE